MNKVYNIILIAISFLAGIFIMSQFKSCTDVPCDKNICYKDSTVVHDSVVIHIDTIPFKAKGPTTTTKGGSKFDSTLYKQCSALTTDSINISDSLISGFVKTKVRNNQLDSLYLSYKPLFPKYIKKDSLVFKTITEYNTIYEPYKQNIFYIGGSVGTNDIGISASFKNKKDLIYGYKFGITYQGLKTHNVEFKLPIFKSKNKTTNKK
jgi:hypothetical protein